MKSNDDPIKLKRVYEKKEKSDGIRLLADRLWPRGVKKLDLEYDEWIKELCPSTALRQQWHNKGLSYSQFSKQYSEELMDQQEKIDCIASLAKKGNVTLISAVKELEISHLPILKKQIFEALEEAGFGDSDDRSSPVCYEKFDN